MTPQIKQIWIAPRLYTEFFSKLKQSKSGCIEYFGKTYVRGYGYLCINGFYWRVHRLMWTLAYGEIKKGKLICHSCDNPKCVNLGHLFLGTYLDNNRDSIRKGRGKKQNGESNASSKLKAKQVKEIRRLYQLGLSQSKIAEQFGVDQSNVSRIVNRKKWREQL